MRKRFHPAGAALVAATVLAGCGGGEDPGGGLPPSAFPPPAVAFEVPGGTRELTYRWDGGPPVAWKGPPAGAVELPWGESGRVRDTRLYEPFHGEPAAGRFGGGRELAAGDVLSFQLGALALPFAVDFWIRPRANRAGQLLTAPGCFALERARDGALVLSLEGAGDLRVRSAAPLRAGAWHHVGVVVDGPELPAVRLVVDGVAAGRRYGEAGVPGLRALEFGGAVFVLDEVRVLERALTTDELAERFAPPLEPGEHVLTVDRDGETRAFPTWVGVIAKPALENEHDWRSGVRDHLALRDGVLRWTEGQWRRDRPDVRPLARTTHPTIYLGAHRIFVFGGETRDTHLPPMVNTNDTWIYRPDRRAWRRVAVDGPAPPPTCHQAAAFSPDHGVVLYPGGWRNDGPEKVTYDETWLYRVDEERWERRAPGGPELGPVSGTALAYHPPSRKFVMIYRREVLAYDPDADRWERLPYPRLEFESGEPIQYLPGSSPMTGFDPGTGQIVVFGGVVWSDGEPRFQDVTAHWDFEAGVIVVKDVGESPTPRVRSAFAYDAKRGRFVLFGGVRDQFSERHDDLWTYDAAAARWTRVDAADTPPVRGGFYGMAFDPELDRFLVLCGRHAPNRFLNEAVRLHLDPEAEARGTWVFDRAGFRERALLTCDLRLDGGAAAAFRFAASEDLAAWTPWSEAPADGRYLKVEVTLRPGRGAAPELLALGFVEAEPAAAPAGAARRTFEVVRGD